MSAARARRIAALCGMAAALALAPVAPPGAQAAAPDAAAAHSDEGAEPMQAGRLGTVRLFPAAEARQFVILFSGPGGWSAADSATARALAAKGMVVAGVDLRGYRQALAASGDGCHYVVADLEELGHQVERRLGFDGYRSPILVSGGPDAALAYAALSQAPDVTIAGAISLGFGTTLATPVPLCPGAASSKTADGRFRYRPERDLPGWWRIVAGPRDTAAARAFASGIPSARVLAAQGDAAAQIAAALATAPASGSPNLAGLRNLPVVELPAKEPGPLMAVIYSGDGGWRDIDKQIGGWLRAHGVSVVGVDSLRYFWSAKPPERVAADLDRLLRAYQARWPGRRPILIGYSFGADILPFAVDRLPPTMRNSVVQVTLLGLEPTAEFEFHVGSWLSGDGDNGVPIAPEIARLDKGRVQCIYGAHEDDTACTMPQLRGAELRRVPGDHHFDDNYPLVARLILDSAERRLAAGSLVASRQPLRHG